MRNPTTHALLTPLWLVLAAMANPAFAAHAPAAVELSRLEESYLTPFPQLLDLPEQTSAADGETPAAPVADPCADIHAKSIAQLDTPWRDHVVDITLESCEVVPGIEDQPSAATHVHARLREGAMTFAGQPVVEIVMYDSEWGNDHQYIIGRPYREASGPMRRVIERGIDGYTRKMEPAPEPGGLWLTSEGGGIWFHPHPENRAWTMLSSFWSE